MHSDHTNEVNTSEVPPGVRGVLRLEGLCVFLVTLYVYHGLDAGWGRFVLCFFVPDISLLAYLAGPRTGAFFYNAAHSYVGPAMVLGAAMLLPSSLLLGAGVIWASHIGFDRMLGYGLKYGTGFRHTHLGRIGRE